MYPPPCRASSRGCPTEAVDLTGEPGSLVLLEPGAPHALALLPSLGS